MWTYVIRSWVLWQFPESSYLILFEEKTWVAVVFFLFSSPADFGRTFECTIIRGLAGATLTITVRINFACKFLVTAFFVHCPGMSGRNHPLCAVVEWTLPCREQWPCTWSGLKHRFQDEIELNSKTFFTLLSLFGTCVRNCVFDDLFEKQPRRTNFEFQPGFELFRQVPNTAWDLAQDSHASGA